MFIREFAFSLFLFSSSPPLKSRHGEIFIFIPGDDPEGFMPSRSWRDRGRGRGSRQSRNSGEREGWVEGGLKGKRRKNHDAIIFVPARERILSSSSSRAG